MPAHAQVQARTVSLGASRSGATPPPTRSNASQQRASRPRAATLEGEQKVLDTVAKQTAALGYKCTTLGTLAEEVGMTKESLRLRVDALRADGRLRREPCWCATFDTPHVRFYPPGQGGQAQPQAAASVAMAPDAATSPVSVAVAAPREVVATEAATGIRQIVPAQPNTWALYRIGGTVFRDPVIAWGVWDEVVGTTLTSVAGPLVFGGVQLEPASASEGFVGVRIGAFRCLDGQRTFEDGSQAVER